MGENNAERLERLKDINDIKYIFALEHPSGDGCNPNAIDMERDIDWLIEQAGRVQGAEDAAYGLSETYRQEREYNERLQQENKRLREALKDIRGRVVKLPHDDMSFEIYDRCNTALEVQNEQSI